MSSSPASGSLEDEDFRGHKWCVRLNQLRVVGNLATNANGVAYTYIALYLGPLYYFPSMLAQAYEPGLLDACYDHLEALRTVQPHHISLMYLPAMTDRALGRVLKVLQDRIRDWLDRRWAPFRRLNDFVPQRRVFVRDIPFTHREVFDGVGHFSTLRRCPPARIAEIYVARRFADTWSCHNGVYVEDEPVTGLRDLQRLARVNATRMDDAEDIVAMTVALPYLRPAVRESTEWESWLPCYLDGSADYRLQQPSESADMIYFMMLTWIQTPALNIHHALFQGYRDQNFKVQSLDELHVTPVRNARGEADCRFCIPRLEVPLGQL